MLSRLKSMFVAGGFSAAALAFGAVMFTASAHAGVGGAAGIAKKAADAQAGGIKAQTVRYIRRCRPIFRHRWTRFGWRRVFVGRRCWHRPYRHYGYHRPYRRYYGRPGWRRHYGPGWRRGWRRGWYRGGPRIVLRFGR